MTENKYILNDEEIDELCNMCDAESLLGKIFDKCTLDCNCIHRLEYDKLDALCDGIKDGSVDRREAIRSIIALIRTAATGNSDPCPITQKIKEELASNLDGDMTVRMLAEKLGISTYYMLHIFKKETGTTITEYRKLQRLEAAKELLSKSDKSVTEIAHECGFGTSSYFAEVFKASCGVTPVEYRKITKETVRDNPVLEICGDGDLVVYSMLEHKKILSDPQILKDIRPCDDAEAYIVSQPTEEYGFLHESAIIEFGGVLFAAWYNCPRLELSESSPIRFAKSFDGGKVWTEPKKVVDDPTGKILYCPPVFGVQDGKLYMFINEMSRPDCIHSLDLYVYDPELDNFTELWSRDDLTVKLNTNVYTLSNGKLLLPGRWCVRDSFSDVPCVIISDSGKINADWRIVKIQETHDLPYGKRFVHPEMSVIIDGDTVYIFCRSDTTRVPVLFVSKDNGETWSKPISHDIPFSDSKIYSGNLSDGRSYLIGSLYPGRNRLALFVSEREDPMLFTKCVLLRDFKNTKLDICSLWHYPVAHEYDGKLYIIYTYDLGDLKRGAAVSVVDIKSL